MFKVQLQGSYCRLTMSSSLEYGSSSGGHFSTRNFSLSPAFTCDSASSKVPATASIQLCRRRHCVGYYRVKSLRAVRRGREIEVLLPSGCAYALPTVFSCRRRKSDGGGVDQQTLGCLSLYVDDMLMICWCICQWESESPGCWVGF